MGPLLCANNAGTCRCALRPTEVAGGAAPPPAGPQRLRGRGPPQSLPQAVSCIVTRCPWNTAVCRWGGDKVTQLSHFLTFLSSFLGMTCNYTLTGRRLLQRDVKGVERTWRASTHAAFCPGCSLCLECSPLAHPENFSSSCKTRFNYHPVVPLHWAHHSAKVTVFSARPGTVGCSGAGPQS